MFVLDGVKLDVIVLDPVCVWVMVCVPDTLGVAPVDPVWVCVAVLEAV